jgi:hypothetical protein
MYGGTKMWGCLWFEEWKSNVLQAHALDQVMQVFSYCTPTVLTLYPYR